MCYGFLSLFVIFVCPLLSLPLRWNIFHVYLLKGYCWHMIKDSGILNIVAWAVVQCDSHARHRNWSRQENWQPWLSSKYVNLFYRLLQNCSDDSLNVALPMRMLEVFSSENTYLPVLQDSSYVVSVIEQILHYMVHNGKWGKLWRWALLWRHALSCVLLKDGTALINTLIFRTEAVHVCAF